VTANWFGGFTLGYVSVGEAVLQVRHGGAGPPVLLLHSHPPGTRPLDSGFSSSGDRWGSDWRSASSLRRGFAPSGALILRLSSRSSWCGRHKAIWSGSTATGAGLATGGSRRAESADRLRPSHRRGGSKELATALDGFPRDDRAGRHHLIGTRGLRPIRDAAGLRLVLPAAQRPGVRRRSAHSGSGHAGRCAPPPPTDHGERESCVMTASCGRIRKAAARLGAVGSQPIQTSDRRACLPEVSTACRVA